MNSGTTNIDDLPTSGNISFEVKDNNLGANQQAEQHPQIQKEEGNTTVAQLSQNDLNKIITGIQQASSNNMTSLPSRDIPQDPSQITNDNQIQPNYIPQNENNNYIENEESMDEIIKRNKKESQEKSKSDSLINELQTPILLVLLFFLFELPIINKNLFKYLPNLFLKDGNMNFIGFVVKSLMFGILYYAITKLIKYVE